MMGTTTALTKSFRFRIESRSGLYSSPLGCALRRPSLLLSRNSSVLRNGPVTGLYYRKRAFFKQFQPTPPLFIFQSGTIADDFCCQWWEENLLFQFEHVPDVLYDDDDETSGVLVGHFWVIFKTLHAPAGLSAIFKIAML